MPRNAARAGTLESRPAPYVWFSKNLPEPIRQLRLGIAA